MSLSYTDTLHDYQVTNWLTMPCLCDMNLSYSDTVHDYQVTDSPYHDFCDISISYTDTACGYQVTKWPTIPWRLWHEPLL